MQGCRDSDSDNAAAMAASDDSMNAEYGDSSSDENSPVMIEVWSDASTGADEAGMESYEHVRVTSMFGITIESWMLMMVTGTPQEGENGSDTTRASGGDGGRGSVAPPGVGYSPYAKGVGKGKGKGKVRDEIWMIGMMTPIIQPPDTDLDQEVRRQYEAQYPRLPRRSPEAQRRRLQRAEALGWQPRAGNRHRWTTEDWERLARIRTTNQPAAVAAE